MVIVVVLGTVALVILFVIAACLLAKWSQNVIKAAQPHTLLVCIFGAMLLVCSVFVGTGPATNFSCGATVVLLTTGYDLMCTT